MKPISLMLAVLFCVGLSFTSSNECYSQNILRNFLQPAQPAMGQRYPIIAFGDQRQYLKSLPIEQRPYRPLHFFGNMVRRNYYGGSRY